MHIDIEMQDIITASLLSIVFVFDYGSIIHFKS